MGGEGSKTLRLDCKGGRSCGSADTCSLQWVVLSAYTYMVETVFGCSTLITFRRMGIA